MRKITFPWCRMRLADGTVWSIPITLAVDDKQAASLQIGERVKLVGDQDGVTYGLLEVQSIYQVDQGEEARRVFKTDDPEHPGVKKLLERPATYVGGPIQVLNRPKPSKFEDFIMILQIRGRFFRRRVGRP